MTEKKKDLYFGPTFKDAKKGATMFRSGIDPLEKGIKESKKQSKSPVRWN